MKRIVVGYDDSESAQRALRRAADFAEKFGSELIVTSVAPILVGGPRSAGPTDSTDSFGDHLQELVHARSHLEERGLHAEYVPAVGEPGQTIAHLAADRKADLIVVGTREPTLLERVLGQSVSGRVSHRAHCDVLIVH